jgi:hypothetical protein
MEARRVVAFSLILIAAFTAGLIARAQSTNVANAFVSLTRAEWLQLILSVTGISFIAWQTFLTRRSVEAVNKTVELQRLGMEQWVDIDDPSAETGYVPPHATEAVLCINFDIVNSTKFKLTLLHTEVWIDRESVMEEWHRRQLLAPDEYAIMETIHRPLKGAKFRMWRENRLRYELGMRVRFIDIFGAEREQLFGFHCSTMPGCRTEFIPIAFEPPSASELEAHRKRKEMLAAKAG